MKKNLRNLFVRLGRSLGFKAKGPFRRYLTASEAQTLAGRINAILGTDMEGARVLETAGIIRRIETQMIGRIAGDIDDHILNYHLVRQAAAKLPANATFVEIGVLFGGSLLVLMHAIADENKQRKILAIDPLDSYYGESVDPVTLLPINRHNVLANVNRSKYPAADFSLISTPSELPETVESLRSVEIGVIYIDGDHSYEGVKRDWVNYSSRVVLGGYALIDNYRDGYEGIDRFVDDELVVNNPGWRMAGSVNRSIVFEKTEN